MTGGRLIEVAEFDLGAKPSPFAVARRNQLLELINQGNNRLMQLWDDDAQQSIRDVLDVLKKDEKH